MIINIILLCLLQNYSTWHFPMAYISIAHNWFKSHLRFLSLRVSTHLFSWRDSRLAQKQEPQILWKGAISFLKESALCVEADWECPVGKQQINSTRIPGRRCQSINTEVSRKENQYQEKVRGIRGEARRPTQLAI